MSFEQVGATGFEPATPRPPAECATGLRHAPNMCLKLPQFESNSNGFSSGIEFYSPVKYHYYIPPAGFI